VYGVERVERGHDHDRHTTRITSLVTQTPLRVTVVVVGTAWTAFAVVVLVAEQLGVRVKVPLKATIPVVSGEVPTTSEKLDAVPSIEVMTGPAVVPGFRLTNVMAKSWADPPVQVIDSVALESL
jgi:hypothetical protein